MSDSSSLLGGTTGQRLASLLLKHGIKATLLVPAQGWWRTSRQSEAYRWEGSGVVVAEDGVDGVPKGVKVGLVCWDTMTDCLKRGVRLTKDGHEIHVSAIPDARSS